jgi:hypothetical protein
MPSDQNGSRTDEASLRIRNLTLDDFDDIVRLQQHGFPG